MSAEDVSVQLASRALVVIPLAAMVIMGPTATFDAAAWMMLHVMHLQVAVDV